MTTGIQESEPTQRREELLNKALSIQKDLEKLLDGFQEDRIHLNKLRELLPNRDSPTYYTKYS